MKHIFRHLRRLVGARVLCAPSAALLLALLAPSRAHAIAASQAWVEAYVSNYVANTSAQLQADGSTYRTNINNNAATVYSVGEGSNALTLIIEDATDAALQVTNATAAATAQSVTNGTLFVWNGAGAYINPLGSITCTKTNMVYSGVGSTYDSAANILSFKGYFDALPVLIQPSTSLNITNSLTEVLQ